MFQNSKTKYQIPIDWNNKDRYVVCLDFTAKQDLYAILNDGSVYKIKYNERKAKKKLTSEKFKGVEIVKAKLFEKGFIAFTNISQFYYVKNIKNIFPVLICYLPPYLEFNLNVDFIPIPAENTTSKKIEVLITKQDGEGGIIQIPVKEEGENAAGAAAPAAGAATAAVAIASSISTSSTKRLSHISLLSFSSKSNLGTIYSKKSLKEGIAFESVTLMQSLFKKLHPLCFPNLINPPV